MEIKVLGTGCCNKCAALLRATEQAVKELKIKATIEEITDIEKIIEYDIMRTPGLVIDGRVVSSGKVLTVEEVKQFILMPKI